MRDCVTNLLDEKQLKNNIQFASLFILYFECLKDFVVNQVRDFYSRNVRFEDDKMISEESAEYKKEVRNLDKHIDTASMKWFLESEAINESDFKMYKEIRQRRNDIVHELMKNLTYGFDEKDFELFNTLANLYFKLDKWWINEIEIPISADDIPDNYDKEAVSGGQAAFLSAIRDIINGNGDTYREVIDLYKKLK